MHGRMTTAGRLTLGFGVLLLLLVLSVSLGLNRLKVLNHVVERAVVHDWEHTVLANNAIDLMHAQTRDTLLLFQVHDPAPVRKRIVQRVETIGKLLAELDRRLVDPRSRTLIERILVERAAYVASFSEVAAMLEAGQREAASRHMIVETVPALDTVLASMDALIRLQGDILVDTGSDSLRTFESARQTLVVFLVAAIIASLLMSIWIIRAVVRPLGGEPEDARAVVERIASGHLDAEIRLRPGDADSLLAAMRTMQRNLRELIDARIRADRALRESRQRFQELVENLRDWIWEVDAEWRYTYASPQVREILGYEPEELIGRTPFELMPAEEAERVRAAVEACRSGLSAIATLENVNLHKSGRRIVLESSGRPFFDDSGDFAGYRGVDREITDRREAEAARLTEAIRLRDALVREVHHRIKNNLQTVVGLLRREADKRPAVRVAIESAIAQVQSVAVVHGLYGRVTRHSVMLCELLPAVVRSVADLTSVAIGQDGLLPPKTGGLLIHESETVAVALILNELVTNAVKHSVGQASSIPRVHLSREGDRGVVRILNPGSLDPGFDFDSGRGVGTGLGLVRALMPQPGMSVAFRQGTGVVEVEVSIEPPIVVLHEPADDPDGVGPALGHRETV